MLKKFLQDTSTKNKNGKQVYHVIKKLGPISKSQISKQIPIKQSTLGRVIDELKRNHFIREYGYGESEGGRPPVLYDIVPDAGYIISLHIIRAQTRVVLFDLNLNPIEETSFVMTKQHTPEKVIPKIINIIQKLAHEFNISNDSLLGLGLVLLVVLIRRKVLL